MATTTISPAAADALRGATMTDTTLTLPQVTPTVYAELKKVIQRTGGAWVRKLGTHVYPTDPRPIIAEILGDGAAMPTMPRDADKDAAFFRTPEDVADALILAALPAAIDGMSIFEPSAGDGAIVDRLVHQYGPGVREQVHCIEPDRGRYEALVAKGYPASHCTLEEWMDEAPFPPRLHDAVLMNPPFATPGNPVLWADHVLRAWDLVRPGGVLAAIIPANLTRQHKTVAQVRALVDEHGRVDDIEDGAFKASGTGVRTKLLVLFR